MRILNFYRPQDHEELLPRPAPKPPVSLADEAAKSLEAGHLERKQRLSELEAFKVRLADNIQSEAEILKLVDAQIRREKMADTELKLGAAEIEIEANIEAIKLLDHDEVADEIERNLDRMNGSAPKRTRKAKQLQAAE